MKNKKTEMVSMKDHLQCSSDLISDLSAVQREKGLRDFAV